MSGYPSVAPPGTLITSVGRNAISGGAVANSGLTAASAVWPAAARTIHVGIVVERVVTVPQMFAYNGATAAGNTDIGLYDGEGNRLVSMGATAQSGTSVIQVFNITDTVLTPGIYFISMSNSGTTGTYLRCALSTQVMEASSCFQDATSMPVAFSFAAPASAFLPIFGAVTVATI